MKIRIETDDNLSEPEVVIRCAQVDEDVRLVQTALLDVLSQNRKLTLIKDSKEYFLSPNNILFFEAVDGRTYAHLPKDVLGVKSRLYELEDTLPSSFVRVSKSAIINSKAILSISRNIAGPSLVQFRGSHKQISVSRSYYKDLKNKL